MQNYSEKVSADDRYRRNVGKRRHRVDDRRPAMGPMVTHRAMRCDKVALRFLQTGTVVRAQVTFSEGVGQKMRPVIVVAVRGGVVEAIPCTSSPRTTSAGDVVLVDLADAGLSRRTMARTARHVYLTRAEVVEVLGHLSAADLATVLLTDREVA